MNLEHVEAPQNALLRVYSVLQFSEEYGGPIKVRFGQYVVVLGT